MPEPIRKPHALDTCPPLAQWFDVEWIDGFGEPQVTPNPEYPNGVDLDISLGAIFVCVAVLPYPAKRCGAYIVNCRKCGVRVGLTTAGRPDDPVQVTIACKVAVDYGTKQ